MKKVIVTGADGFVGNAVIDKLYRSGAFVYAVVKEGVEYELKDTMKDRIKIIHCSMENYKKLPELINDINIDSLYHFAWIGTSGQLRGDYEIQMQNVINSCDLIIAAKKLLCNKIIFSASIMEYEVYSAINSGKTIGINSLYSIAKLSADFFMRSLANNIGVSYIRAVISNIYGPGEKSQRLINSSLRKMLNGEHCSFSPGNQIYDFIYISDAAEAFECIGNMGVNNRTYYIGSLNPRPLKEFLIEMRDAVDPDIKIGLGEIPFEGVSLSYDEFDIYALKNEMGFVPNTDFKTGIINTINWIKENV